MSLPHVVALSSMPHPEYSSADLNMVIWMQEVGYTPDTPPKNFTSGYD